MPDGVITIIGMLIVYWFPILVVSLVKLIGKATTATKLRRRI